MIKSDWYILAGIGNTVEDFIQSVRLGGTEFHGAPESTIKFGGGPPGMAG